MEHILIGILARDHSIEMLRSIASTENKPKRWHVERMDCAGRTAHFRIEELLAARLIRGEKGDRHSTLLFITDRGQKVLDAVDALEAI